MKELILAILTKSPGNVHVYTPDYKTTAMQLEYANGVMVDIIKARLDIETRAGHSYEYTGRVLEKIHIQGQQPVIKVRAVFPIEQGAEIFEKHFPQDIQEDDAKKAAKMIMKENNVPVPANVKAMGQA